MTDTVFITGSSCGIGKAIAENLAYKGYNIVLHGFKHVDEVREMTEKLKKSGVNAMYVTGDVSVSSDVKSMYEKIRLKFKKVDILINNAGIDSYGLVTDVTDEEFQKIFAVNVGGVFYCVREALPDMISEKRGKIINIASMWGICGASCEVLYSASKGAIISMTKALAKELAPSGIRVNAVAPGAIMTDMMKNLGEDVIKCVKDETPLGFIGTAEDIANTVAFLVSSDSDFITGQVISPNGGMVI